APLPMSWNNSCIPQPFLAASPPNLNRQPLSSSARHRAASHFLVATQRLQRMIQMSQSFPLRMPPRLTIAIPTVNRAGLLGRAIESALAQTSTDIEILVSDNGSTDGTPQVIARYAGQGIRTFRHERTMPAERHGEFVINQAQGEFFLGLSDDDYLEPQFAAKV